MAHTETASRPSPDWTGHAEWSGAVGFGAGDEDYGYEAEEEDGAFDVGAAAVEGVEVLGERIGAVGGVDGAAGGDAVAVHGRDDDELRVGGADEHEEQEDHGREDGAGFVDVPGRSEGEQGKSDDAGDEADVVEDAEELSERWSRQRGSRGPWW